MVAHGIRQRANARSRSRPRRPAKRLGTAVDATADDVDRAVAAARAAFRPWRDTPAQERAKAIRKASAILRRNAEELAWLEALDTGNPFQAMLYDVEISADYMDYFAGLVTEIKGSTIPIGAGTLNYTLREPLGVVARIGAFNHPLLFVAGKCGAPLAAGNTLDRQAGRADAAHGAAHRGAVGRRVPAGRIQRRDRRARCGRCAGRASEGGEDRLHRKRCRRPCGDEGAGATLKALTLELGGKNALIACADATPDEVADGVVRGMNFRYVTGQSCNSTSRVYLHTDIHDATLPEIVKRVAAIRIGLPTERDTEMSCLSSQAQFDKTMSYIKLGVDGGARLAYGGKRPADPKLARGFFVEPTVFADVTDDMRIAREEIFGPVVSILRWSDENDLLARVNALDVGLTASIWTHDLDRAHRLASKVEAGYIWINGASTHHVGVPVRRLQAVGHGPRGIDRGAPRLHADQERERHASARRDNEDKSAKSGTAGDRHNEGGGHHASADFAGHRCAARRHGGQRLGGGDRGRKLWRVGQRHAVRRRPGEGLLQGGRAQHHRADLVGGRRNVAAQHAGRRRRSLRRSEPRRGRVRNPRRRGSQDRQRQRAHRGGVRVGGEAEFADQDDQGPQGQEDRLHQSALDQPGARGDAAADRRATSPRTPSW